MFGGLGTSRHFLSFSKSLSFIFGFLNMLAFQLVGLSCPVKMLVFYTSYPNFAQILYGCCFICGLYSYVSIENHARPSDYLSGVDDTLF